MATLGQTLGTITINVPANGETNAAITGQFFTVLTSNHQSFKIGLGDQSQLADFAAGLSYRMPSEAVFHQVRIVNTSGTALTVELAYGFGTFRDGRLVIDGGIAVLSPDTVTSTADVTATASTTSQLIAANLDRKELFLVNMGSATLRIGDSNAGASRGVPLAPGEKMIMTTTAAVSAYNPDASGCDVAIIETEQS